MPASTIVDFLVFFLGAAVFVAVLYKIFQRSKKEFLSSSKRNSFWAAVVTLLFVCGAYQAIGYIFP